MSRANEKKVVKGAFVVLNDKGLHTRPSTELVRCASKFDAQIFLFFRDDMVNAKSLLGILMLAAERGSRIFVEATGSDAQEAVDALLELAERRFYMKY